MYMYRKCYIDFKGLYCTHDVYVIVYLFFLILAHRTLVLFVQALVCATPHLLVTQKLHLRPVSILV